MSGLSKKLKDIENRIEQALWEMEIKKEFEKALTIYREAESELTTFDMLKDDPEYREKQRILAYCLMRQGNILRQMGEKEKALLLGKRELEAAEASNNDIALARSLMTNAMNTIIEGNSEIGMSLLDKSRDIYEKGESYEHKQGLGWYWIILADMANAKIIDKQPREIINITNMVLDMLMPLENWQGVARAYLARSKAYERLGNSDAAKKDLLEAQLYENKTG